jgi:hypothetical protein
MKITQEELEAIRKCAEAATPGPWQVGAVPNLIFVETLNSELVLEKASGSMQDYNTAEFIAHAREDVPKLLAEIARLNLANDTLRGNIKTIETLTECTDTKDFAKRALIGEATIRI